MSQFEALSGDIRSIQPAREGRELNVLKNWRGCHETAEHSDTNQDKSEIGNVDTWEPNPRVVSFAISDASRLRMITRALDIGDSIQSKLLLEVFHRKLESSAEEYVRDSLEALTLRYSNLLQHEALHGRLCLLDHSAVEIVRYEQEMRRKQLPSKYS